MFNAINSVFLYSQVVLIPKSNEQDKCSESGSFYSPSQPDNTNSQHVSVYFISYSISTKCLTKEVLELIKEPLTKKAKTAESCVEMSNEGGNYDYSTMTLVATISVKCGVHS